jgi:Flp pilus assembly protein TadD
MHSAAKLQSQKIGNGTKALQLAQRTCQAMQNRDARALDVLAAAYAETGRFQRAVQVGERALELALSSGRSNLAKQIKAHLKLYRSHQPIHGQP